MTTHIALVRGINVGGRRRLRMADLRALLEDLGYGQVTTVLQSGNAVFTAGDSAAQVARRIEERLAGDHGLDVTVLVRSREELVAVVDGNPFSEATATPAKLHVAFLSDDPAPGRLAGIEPAEFAPDELRAGARALYLWYPNGAGRSKLTNDVLERRLGVRATARNWNTVTKLLALAGGADGGPP